MLYIASKLLILMVSHNYGIYCQIGLLYKKKNETKAFDIHIKEFITIKYLFTYVSLFFWCEWKHDTNDFDIYSY